MLWTSMGVAALDTAAAPCYSGGEMRSEDQQPKTSCLSPRVLLKHKIKKSLGSEAARQTRTTRAGWKAEG